MRIYENCKEAINEIKRNLYELSVEVHPHSMQNKIVKDNEDFKTKELQNESFTILDTSDKDQIVGNCLEWCQAEFEERISSVPKNPGEAYKKRPQVWLQFINKEGKFCYTYSERMHSQLNKVIEELKINPDSRQGVIDLHRPSDVSKLGGKERIPCFLKGTKIVSDKIENIEDLKVGDNVLCDDGKYNKINKTMKQKYKGKINIIDCAKYSEKIEMTPEHPVLCLDNAIKTYEKFKPNVIKALKNKEIKPEFKEAKDITKNDYLAFAFPNTTKNQQYLDVTKYLDSDYKIKAGKIVQNPNSFPIYKKIELTKELGMIFGYYLSEGDITFDKRNGAYKPSCIRFSFSIKEDNLVKEVIDLFKKVFGITNYNIQKYKQYNSQRISFSNRVVCEMIINLFGHMAKNKYISKELYYLDKDFQKGIIIGFMKGDGGKSLKNGLYNLNTGVVSVNLIQGIRTLLLRQGIVPSFGICHRKIDSKIKSIGKRECTVYRLDYQSDDLTYECFGLKNKKRQKQNSIGFIHDGIAYYNCKGNETRNYNGYVYNLAVDKRETYNLIPFTVHNCSLEYIFQIRKHSNKDAFGRVNIIYNMRSCDFSTHFKNDIWLAAELKNHVAKELDLIPGSLIMNIASLHIYKKDWEDNVY